MRTHAHTHVYNFSCPTNKEVQERKEEQSGESNGEKYGCVYEVSTSCRREISEARRRKVEGDGIGGKAEKRRSTAPAADDADPWGNDTVKTIPTSIQLQL